MKIESISRTISGFDYDNISATATIGENENPIEAAKLLDVETRKMLNAITNQKKAVDDLRSEKQETVSLFKRALEHAEKEDIPF